MATIDTKRRVKHYVLNDARQWVDRGTGHVSWIYNDKQRSVSLIVKSENDGSILLEAKILLSIVYQRQQDTLIVWSDTNRRDLALSFQEKAGCDEIWEKICEVLGEDSSLDITSSRGTATSNGADNLDESDEDQLDTDINTSPTSDLPQCELNKLKEIRDFFILELPRKSKIYKERLASILESDSYIRKLIEIFHICEDLENTEGLHYLFEIFRSLFYLNKSSLLDILLSDDLIMDVIGCLEYDPNKIDPQRHREYITTKSKFKEIISFDNTDLVNKIHQTYKVQYIQDVILPAPSVFEENSLTSLSSFIFLNKVEISNLIQEDDRFLNELFEQLKNVNLEVDKRRDMLCFLREFTSFLHSLQQTREPFFKSLYDHGVLDVIEISLGVRDEKINVASIDILTQFVEVSPTLVREYILNEIESKSSVNNLSASLNKSTNSYNNNSNNLLSTKLSSSSTSSLLSPTLTPNSTTTTKIPSPTNSSSNSLLITLNNKNESTTTVINNNNSSNDVNCVLTTATTTTTTIHVNKTVNDEQEETQSSLLSLEQILNTDEVFEPILINYVIRQMINDPDPELSGAMQIINILKLLIDPENMLSASNKAEKSEFLSYFYRKSMCILITPLMTNTTGLVINREDYRLAQLQNLMLDFLSFCVEHHTYHIKNYIIHKDLLKRILVLLKSKHQFLALSALRFLRKTLSLKEETYNKHIVKANLFQPVVEALKTNGSRYNILNSAIIELFDFIRSDDIKSLMTYIVENFNEDLENITYVRTFRDLKLRYDQHKEKLNEQLTRSRLGSNGGSSGGGECSNTPSLYRTRTSVDRYRDRIDFDKDEDAWIEDDDDESDNRLTEPSLSQNTIGNTSSLTAQSATASSNISSIMISSSSSLSSSSSSSSTHSNSNDENQIESYLEYKKSQNQINLDDNEDTLFSPAKSTGGSTSTSPVHSPSSPSSSASSSSSSSAVSKNSISIKIHTSISAVNSVNNKSKNESNNQQQQQHLNSYNESDQSTINLNSHSPTSSSSSSSSSNPSTPTNSPLCNKKHALVDYEDDSDEDESNEDKEKLQNSENTKLEMEVDYKNGEPLSKRASTESNSVLNKNKKEDQEQDQDQNQIQQDITADCSKLTEQLKNNNINNKTNIILDTNNEMQIESEPQQQQQQQQLPNENKIENENNNRDENKENEALLNDVIKSSNIENSSSTNSSSHSSSINNSLNCSDEENKNVNTNITCPADINHNNKDDLNSINKKITENDTNNNDDNDSTDENENSLSSNNLEEAKSNNEHVNKNDQQNEQIVINCKRSISNDTINNHLNHTNHDNNNNNDNDNNDNNSKQEVELNNFNDHNAEQVGDNSIITKMTITSTSNMQLHDSNKNEATSPPLSPASLSSVEPANKRARLSNS